MVPKLTFRIFFIFYWAVGQIISTFQFLLNAFRGKIILFAQLPCRNAFFVTGCNMGGLPLYKDKVFTVHVMKAYGGGLQVWLHSYLTSTLDRGERLISSPGRCTPRNNPGTHLIGGRVGLTAGLKVLENKYLLLLPRSEPRTIHPVT